MANPFNFAVPGGISIQERMLQQLQAQIKEAKAFVAPEEGSNKQRFFSARRARRLVDRLDSLISALALIQRAGTRPIDEAIQVTHSTLQRTAEVLSFLKTTNIFAYYLQKANIANSFEELNESIGRVRQSAGLRPENGNLAKENRQDKHGDDDAFRILIESVGGSNTAIKTEIMAIPVDQAQVILAALQKLRKQEPSRSRGIGFEAVFLRNSVSVIARYCGQAPSPLSSPSSSAMPSPYVPPYGAMPMPQASNSIPLFVPMQPASEPGGAAQVQPWFSRARAESLSMFAAPESMPTPPLTIPTIPDWLREAAAANNLQSTVPIPERRGSGVQTTLYFYDLKSMRLRTWAPFRDWIFHEPACLSRADVLDKMPIAAGMQATVVQEWTSKGGALRKASTMGRLDRSKLDVLHPPIGDAVYILGVFLINRTTYIAASTVKHEANKVDSTVGLLPADCLSVSGRRPATPSLVTVALHEHAAPFKASMRIDSNFATPIEGVVNAYALEFWTLADSVQPPRVHPFQHIRRAKKVAERREIQTAAGLARSAFFALDFRTLRTSGEERVSLIFNSENEIDEFLATCKLACPMFSVEW